MDNKVYNVGDRIVLRKKHPCGSFEWEIIKLGADIKIKCTTCGRTIFVPRVELNKKIKKVITGGD
jgi:hypothetical protein